ncbi:MAG: hypothetical protein JWP13_641 [Candidatus Saccharibacteria bacterium]|nr:hypothetical protein [Candidatus Saccharibacteria bacterium]
MYERYKGLSPLFYEEVEAGETLRELGIVDVLRTPVGGTDLFGMGVDWETALLSVRAIYEEDGQPAHEIRLRRAEEDLPIGFAIDPRVDGTLWVGTISGNAPEDLVQLNDLQTECLQALLDLSRDAGLQYPDSIDDECADLL